MVDNTHSPGRSKKGKPRARFPFLVDSALCKQANVSHNRSGTSCLPKIAVRRRFSKRNFICPRQRLALSPIKRNLPRQIPTYRFSFSLREAQHIVLPRGATYRIPVRGYIEFAGGKYIARRKAQTPRPRVSAAGPSFSIIKITIDKIR